MERKTIKHVLDNRLCNSCGACSAVCKPNSIKFKDTIAGHNFPLVDEGSCTNCGMCYAVCPGIHFSEVLKNKLSEDPFSGKCLEAFVGKAKNKRIYENSQSGGIVSALALYALESGLADATMTVVMNWGKPPRSEARLARTADEIILSQKSKYCPVPTLSVLKNVIGSEQRIVFIGIPCQVHGLFNIMDKLPKLKDNIVLKIGLVCESVMTSAALDYLFMKGDLGNNVDWSLTFKDKLCGGYPGDIHIQTINGLSKKMPQSVRHNIKNFFVPGRCRICFDKMNIFADITVGDPHRLHGIDRELGESMLAVRTTNGEKIVQGALLDGSVSIRSVEYKDVIDGQRINKKKQQWSDYINLWKRSGYTMPEYYELIKKHTPAPSNNKKYKHIMNHAFNLDNYESRNDLIEYVQKTLEKKKSFWHFFLPARFLK